MRFRTSAKKPPYLNRRDQRRLLYLFGLLLLVLVGMRVAANPSTWNWMFAGREQAKAAAAEERKSADKTPAEKSSSPLRPREFRATTTPEKSATKSADQTKLSQPAGKILAGHSDVHFPPGVFPAAMDDRELGITLGEWDAYIAVLGHAKKVAIRDLEREARDNVSFTNLRQTPDAHRGSVITIEGRLGSLRKIPPGKTKHSLGQLYEAWIVTPESDNEPYRVVFAELPDGLEPTALFDPPPEVRATGYFFKVQKYEAKPNGEEYRYNHAPLLLARRIERLDATNSNVGGFELAPYVIGFSLIVGVVLAITLWRFTRGDRQFAKEHLQRFEDRQHAEATGLNRHAAGETPEEFFARLSEDEESQPNGRPRPGQD